MNRRKFLIGLSGLVAAPAVVRVSSLMPINAWAGVDIITMPDCISGLSVWLQESGTNGFPGPVWAHYPVPQAPGVYRVRVEGVTETGRVIQQKYRLRRCGEKSASLLGAVV